MDMQEAFRKAMIRDLKNSRLQFAGLSRDIYEVLKKYLEENSKDGKTNYKMFVGVLFGLTSNIVSFGEATGIPKEQLNEIVFGMMESMTEILEEETKEEG